MNLLVPDAVRRISRLARFALLLPPVLASQLVLASQPVLGEQPIPVILDTDIGDDVDDTWALVHLLRSPEFDIRLVVGDNAKGIYRAKLIAKLLEIADRTDIPVGIAAGDPTGGGRQEKWIEGYDLDTYPGTVHEDGVQAIIDIVMQSDEEVTLLAIGPVTNLHEALQREPRIATRARFVGMHGSVYRGYFEDPKPSPEFNVRIDIPACQAVFTAPWEMTITPIDTCDRVQLRGENYARLQASKDPLVVALLENYRVWLPTYPQPERLSDGGKTGSSVLFDTVAVYLAHADELCKMESLPLRVDDKGMTVIDPTAKKMLVATEWNDLDGFEEYLTARILGEHVLRPQ